MKHRIAYPYEKGQNSGRYGPCSIHLVTQGVFYCSIHRDKDEHMKAYQEAMLERITEVEAILSAGNLSPAVCRYLEQALKGMKASMSAPSTCTWRITKDNDWEVHVYISCSLLQVLP